MPFFILTLFLLSDFGFASLQKLNIQKLNLSYQLPQGSGEFEKLQIGVNKFSDSVFPVHVERIDSRFDILSPQIEFSWLRPAKFVYELESVETESLNLSLGEKQHSADAKRIKFRPQHMGDFDLEEILLACAGNSRAPRVEHRLREDCLKNLKITVKKVHFPLNKRMRRFAKALPSAPFQDLSGTHLEFIMNDGNFSLNAKLQFFLNSKLKATGHIAYEDRVWVIRIDRVKYGILPVTKLVMKMLQDRIKNPNIEVTPPYIRIRMGHL